jgi:hypothetical protein
LGIHKIVPATQAHIEMMVPIIRKADVEELWATGLYAPRAAMECGLLNSEECFVGFADDNPVCIYGVVPESMLGNVGVPWMVSTHYMDIHAGTFLRQSRTQVMETLGKFNKLLNFVDARNQRSIRWLKWCGFNVDKEPTPWGVFNMPFHKFSMERN